jgi:tetratricopeptide (TPR) repeat protein
MAKQHRVAATRSRTSKPKPRRSGKQALQASAARPARPVVEAPPPPKKPAYYEAISIYETGVRALQRHDFAAAAEQFRLVLHRYPDERELVERATLYLRVCERETANRATGPKTPRERIYAATVALNAGDAEGALRLLRQALSEEPNDDHGHYIMAVALSDRGHVAEAIEHLRHSIGLNPDNRSLARQDPDLVMVRETPAGRELLDAIPASVARKRPRLRR